MKFQQEVQIPYIVLETPTRYNEFSIMLDSPTRCSKRVNVILVTSIASKEWDEVMVVTWNGTGTICGMIGVPSLASGVRS